MIPKKIHYCWFGRGKKTKLAQKCIASWKKFCADYEIIEWNEDNFDVNIHPYAHYCFENQRWAFLSDYVRLWAVNNCGGLYFDTDVEILRNFDDLLEYEAFYGFEDDKHIATGLGFGSIAHHLTISAMLKAYDNICVKQEKIPFIGCPVLNTNALLPLGLKLTGEKQIIKNAVILPVEYLNPLEDATGIIRINRNTYSIHWYAKSALNKKIILRSKITRPFHRILGKNCFNTIKSVFRQSP